jgi:hypothetical protein
LRHARILYEVGFEDPVPEDTDAKLKAAREGVNKWWTVEEVAISTAMPRYPMILAARSTWRTTMRHSRP